jgi:hypothetical protein
MECCCFIRTYPCFQQRRDRFLQSTVAPSDQCDDELDDANACLTNYAPESIDCINTVMPTRQLSPPIAQLVALRLKHKCALLSTCAEGPFVKLNSGICSAVDKHAIQLIVWILLPVLPIPLKRRVRPWLPNAKLYWNQQNNVYRAQILPAVHVSIVHTSKSLPHLTV